MSIVGRIAGNAGQPDLLRVLADEIAPTDLKSLLMEVLRARAKRIKARDVLASYARSAVVRPSGVDGRRFAEFRRIAYATLPARFEALELSPVAPFGSVAGLTNLDQNQVLSTIAGSEVCSDPTNVLALECAIRRREAGREGEGAPPRVDLCTITRCVRPQTRPAPGHVPHFELLALCTAGRSAPDHALEAAWLVDHIDLHISVLKAASPMGLRCDSLRVTTTALEPEAETWLSARVHPEVRSRCRDAHVASDPGRTAGRNYYQTAAFQIFGTNPRGKAMLLTDGGFVPWTQALLGDRKERLLISGLGVERYIAEFGG